MTQQAKQMEMFGDAPTARAGRAGYWARVLER